MSNKAQDNSEYQKIGPFLVHRTTLISIAGWRPNYWNFLPFETREAIDRNVVEQFYRSLERYSDIEISDYDEAYLQWIIHRSASNARNNHWRLCLYAYEDRQREISSMKRINCGARKKTGEQCRAKAVLGRNRCRFHGGKSTGPRTLEGKLKSLSGLPQYRRNPKLLDKKREELIAQLELESGLEFAAQLDTLSTI